MSYRFVNHSDPLHDFEIGHYYHETVLPAEFAELVEPHARTQLFTRAGDGRVWNGCGLDLRLDRRVGECVYIPQGIWPQVRQSYISPISLHEDDAETWPQLEESELWIDESMRHVDAELLEVLIDQPRGHVVMPWPSQHREFVRSLVNSMPNARWAVVHDNSRAEVQLDVYLAGFATHYELLSANQFLQRDQGRFDAIAFCGARCAFANGMLTRMRSMQSAVRYAVLERAEYGRVHIGDGRYADSEFLVDAFFGPRLLE